jgi:hypothetical protein
MHTSRTAPNAWIGGALAALVATVMLALTATSASAAFVHLKASESTVRNDCAAVGGTFSSSSRGYACQKGANSVSCDKGGDCQGFCSNCSDRKAAIKGILHGSASGAKTTGGNERSGFLHRPTRLGGAMNHDEPKNAGPSRGLKPLMRLQRR